MSIFPTKILLATDGSEDAELAAATAVELANSTGSETHIVNVGVVAPALFRPLDVGPDRVEREARRILDEQMKRIEQLGGKVVQSHVRIGDTAKEIVALAEEMNAGLIMIGSRGLGGVKRALMGSVSDSVVRHAHCPVIVMRGYKCEGSTFFPTKILSAVDGSKEGATAARAAVELSEKTDSELHVVHAWQPIPHYAYPSLTLEEYYTPYEEGARRILDEQVKYIEAAGGTVEQAHLRPGTAATETVDLAEDLGAGLIVVGSRGLAGIRRALMGSVSDSVVRHAHGPVLVVRSQEEPT